jgi:hypothetical protein
LGRQPVHVRGCGLGGDLRHRLIGDQGGRQNCAVAYRRPGFGGAHAIDRRIRIGAGSGHEAAGDDAAGVSGGALADRRCQRPPSGSVGDREAPQTRGLAITGGRGRQDARDLRLRSGAGATSARHGGRVLGSTCGRERCGRSVGGRIASPASAIEASSAVAAMKLGGSV